MQARIRAQHSSTHVSLPPRYSHHSMPTRTLALTVKGPSEYEIAQFFSGDMFKAEGRGRNSSMLRRICQSFLLDCFLVP